MTLGMITYAVYQTDSAWPPIYVLAAIGGAGAGYNASTEDSETDTQNPGETSAANTDIESVADAGSSVIQPLEVASAERNEALPHSLNASSWLRKVVRPG